MSAPVEAFVPGQPEQPRFYERMRRLSYVLTPPLFKIDSHGLEHVPAVGAVILAGNHLSSFDILSVAMPIPRIVHFMAKAEYMQNKLAYTTFVRLESFFVRRGEGDMEAIRNALAVLKAQQLLFIYPEGHRTESHAMIKAHEGLALIAYKSGAPVIPVATWGSEYVTKGGRLGPFRPTIHVHYGQPLQFTPAGKRATREELQSATETIMRAIAAMLPPRYRGVYGDVIVPIQTTPAVATSDLETTTR